MTVHSLSTIFCDSCDEESFTFEGSAEVTRRAAWDMGWVVGSPDRCPTCVANLRDRIASLARAVTQRDSSPPRDEARDGSNQGLSGRSRTQEDQA